MLLLFTVKGLKKRVKRRENHRGSERCIFIPGLQGRSGLNNFSGAEHDKGGDSGNENGLDSKHGFLRVELEMVRFEKIGVVGGADEEAKATQVDGNQLYNPTS